MYPHVFSRRTSGNCNSVTYLGRLSRRSRLGICLLFLWYSGLPLVPILAFSLLWFSSYSLPDKPSKALKFSTYAKRLYYVCLFKNSLGGESVHRSPYSIKEPRHSTSISSINRHFEEPSFHFLVNGALRAQLGTLHTIDGIANLSLQYSTLSPQGCK